MHVDSLIVIPNERLKMISQEKITLMNAFQDPIWEPLSAFAISSLLSSAARWPISGSAPAPRPLVSLEPSCTFVAAWFLERACWSVFIAMNSTPCRPSLTMRLTALPPPPPTPMTFIVVTFSSISSSSMSAISLSSIGFYRDPRLRAQDYTHTEATI